MPGQLPGLFGLMAQRRRSHVNVDVLLDGYLSEEVSEYKGILLVRLRAGNAMQVRLQGSDVLTRTVPIANATHVGEHPPWRLASSNYIWAWIQSNAAIWRWLVSKGLDVEATKQRLNNTILPGHPCNVV